MVSREDVKEAALSLLKVIAIEGKRKLGANIEVRQRSSWMVKTSATSSTSENFMKKVFNSADISMMYQIDMRTNFPEKDRLTDMILEAGIERGNIEYGLLLTLVGTWMRVRNPLDIDGDDVGNIIEDFASTIIDKVVEIQAKYAVLGMDEKSEEVIFEDEVRLRRISEEELWEYGKIGSVFSPTTSMGFMTPMDTLSDDWMIIEINKKHGLKENVDLKNKKNAMLINMLMASSGKFRVIDLGTSRKSWFGGTSLFGDRFDSYVSISGSSSYLLDGEVKSRMIKMWPKIIKVVESGGSLLLPTGRLLDGLSRRDLKDTVIDYAIGLEALLTLGEPVNMSYRFALRGAQIINWGGGDKKEWYEKLKDFYETRNIIVHGRTVGRDKLSTNSKVGEEALKEILWWYIENDIDDIKEGTKMVDERILE